MNIGNYRAEKLTVDTIDDTLMFCDQYLGKGLYSYDDLVKIAGCKHHYFYIVYDCLKKIGIFYCYADVAGEVSDHFTGEILKSSQADEWIGVCRSIALTEQYRHLGISEQLLSFFSDILNRKENVCRIYVLAWIKKEYVPAQKHLEVCGYKALKIIKNPWYTVKKLTCPVCHETNCKCNGILYCKSYKGEM